MRWTIFIVMISIIWSACGKQDAPNSEKPLAKVYDKYLYPSDLKGIFDANMTKEDSSQRIQAFIDSWAKEHLMVRVAEENIPTDVDINKMVEDYRESIVKYHYERNLVAKRLDSLVSNTEIQAHYQKTKGDYILKHDIVQCYFLQIPSNSPNKEKLKEWWKMKDPIDYAKVKDYAAKYAHVFILEDSTWIRAKDLAAQFPQNSLSEGSLTKGKEVSMNKKGYRFLLRVNKVFKKGQQAPVSYVKRKIIDYLLHQRKLELIKNMSNEMYQRELNKQNVVIYDGVLE